MHHFPPPLVGSTRHVWCSERKGGGDICTPRYPPPLHPATDPSRLCLRTPIFPTPTTPTAPEPTSAELAADSLETARITVRLNTTVTAIRTRGRGGALSLSFTQPVATAAPQAPTQASAGAGTGPIPIVIGAADPTPPKDGPPVSESFDAVVVCVPAPAALSMLTLLPVAQGAPYLDPAVTTYAITQRWDARLHCVMSWGKVAPATPS
jgi:hypothetical protein